MYYLFSVCTLCFLFFCPSLQPCLGFFLMFPIFYFHLSIGLFSSIILFSFFSACSRDYKIHSELFTVNQNILPLSVKYRKFTTTEILLPPCYRCRIYYNYIYFKTIRQCHEFCFQHQTYFKELMKRSIYYYSHPVIYYFCCSAFIPDIPSFLLVSFPFSLKKFL